MLPVITWKTVEVVDRAEVFRISTFAVDAKRLQEVMDEARSEDTKSCRVLKRVAFTDIYEPRPVLSVEMLKEVVLALHPIKVLRVEKKGRKLEVCPIVVESVENALREILEKVPRVVLTELMPNWRVL